MTRINEEKRMMFCRVWNRSRPYSTIFGQSFEQIRRWLDSVQEELEGWEEIQILPDIDRGMSCRCDYDCECEDQFSHFHIWGKRLETENERRKRVAQEKKVALTAEEKAKEKKERRRLQFEKLKKEFEG